MKISKNFTLDELTRSDTAEERKISNAPNKQEIANMKLLCKNILQPLRDNIGYSIRINSCFRSEALNRAVGGVSTSAHRHGLAADIVCNGYAKGDVKEFALYIEQFLRSKKIKFDQLIYEHVGGAKWVHIGIKHPDGRQRGQVITIKGRKTYAGIV